MHEFAHDAAGVGCGCVTDAADDEAAIVVGEVDEAGQRDDPREPVCECGIERFNTVVARVVVSLRIGGRIGRGPSIAQRRDVDALDAAFVNDRKEFVRDVGDGESGEIVELQDARVVVAQRELKRVRESLQPQRFRGAVIADEQQRLFGGEGGEERGFERVVADDASVVRFSGRI